MLPILEEGGLVCGEDFFLAYSPERENPADAKFETASIPKVVGGIGDDALRLASEFYGRVVCDVVPVASAEIAEASKIVENVYRCVNIALVNELKLAFDKMDIDVWDVIKASATKPFGFQPFWPGPGLGGHCIPIDPFYLSWRARQCGAEARFIELAGEINTSMPSIVVERTCDELGTAAGNSVLVIGVSYKPNVSDIRETPAAPIIEMLQERGCDVSYHDPHCPEFPAMKRYAIDLQSVPLDEASLGPALASPPREIERINRNAVATKSRPWPKWLEAKWLRRGRLDDVPHIDVHFVKGKFELIYQRNVDASVDVLDNL